MSPTTISLTPPSGFCQAPQPDGLQDFTRNRPVAKRLATWVRRSETTSLSNTGKRRSCQTTCCCCTPARFPHTDQELLGRLRPTLAKPTLAILIFRLWPNPTLAILIFRLWPNPTLANSNWLTLAKPAPKGGGPKVEALKGGRPGCDLLRPVLLRPKPNFFF